jgi:hypothetical protein
MTDQEAIQLLAGCKKLAQALEKEEFDHTLTADDLLRLADFKQVWLTNLATREDLWRASGLSASQILWLAHLLSAHQAHQLRQLYHVKAPPPAAAPRQSARGPGPGPSQDKD